VQRERPTGGEQGSYERYLSKTTKEAGFTFSGRLFALVFGFAAQAVIARLLGSDLLGVYVLAWTVVMAVSLVTTFGFEGSFVRFIAMYVSRGEEDEARSVFSLGIRVGLLLSVVCTAAVILLREPIARGIFKEPRLAPALLLIAVGILPYTLSRLAAAGLRALKDMRSNILAVEVWLRIFRLAAFLVLFALGLRLMGLVAAIVFASGVSAVAAFAYLRRKGPFLLKGATRATIPAREVLSYSAAMLGETGTAFALLHAGRLLLGVFMTSAEVGVYNIAVLLSTMAMLFVYSFNAIFSPIVADVYHGGNPAFMASLLRAITRWILLLTLPLYAWIVLCGEPVLGIFGPEFVAGYAALVILATGQLLDSAASSVASCLAMTGYQRFNVYNTLALAVVSVGLNIVLIPRFGIVGAAVATAVALVLANVARLIEGKFLLGVVPYDRSTIKAVVVGVVLMGAVLAARSAGAVPGTWYWSAVLLVACYGLAAGVTALLGISDEDRVVVGTLLRRLTPRARRS